MSNSVQTHPTGFTAEALARAARLETAEAQVAPLYCLSVAGSLAAVILSLHASVLYAGWPAFATIIVVVVAHGLIAAVLRGERRAWPRAYAAVAVCVASLVWATMHTGGIASAFAMFFILPPLEALLTRAPRRAMHVAVMAALGFVTAIALSPYAPQMPAVSEQVQLALHTLAVLYALSLAARLVKLANLKDLRLYATQRAIDQFHAVTHDVFAIIRRDGHVERAFGAVEAVLQLERSAVEGEGLMNRIHVADRPRVLSALDAVHVHGGRATVDARLRFGASSAPQGFVWTEIDLSTVGDARGGTEIYALIRDISAIKDHEAELLQAREKAEASDAAKGRFLATMSHELRTPLNAIIGFADILDEEVFGPLNNDQQREYVGLIRESGGHLLQLVNDLLDMSKLEAGHFQIVAEPFAVSAIVKRCVRLMSSQFEKAGQTVVLDLPDNLPELIADQRALRQVMLNLLSNASKFTPDGGRITVRARRDGPMLSLAVIDTGIGLCAADLKRLGEPFFQANNGYDRNHQGTGLGLSVVRGLCELHDGSVAFTSVEGEGTTVTVRLPFAGPRQHPTDMAEPGRADTALLFAKLNRERPAAAMAPESQPNLPESAQAPTSDERKQAHG